MIKSLVQRAGAVLAASVVLALAAVFFTIAAAFAVHALALGFLAPAPAAGVTALTFAVVTAVAALLLPHLAGLRARPPKGASPPLDPAATRMLIEAGAVVADVMSGFRRGQNARRRMDGRGRARRDDRARSKRR